MLLALSAEAEIRVPAFTAYCEPDQRGPRISDSGVTDWTDPAVKVLWFGQLNTTGTVDCALSLRLPPGAVSKLRLTVAGQARELTARGAEGTVTANFGSFNIAATGYQRFALESLNPPGRPAGDLTDLVVDGPAAKGALFNLESWRRGPSVHLAYPLAKEVKVGAFYCEVTAVEDPVGTYYEACGWHRGYFGMQVNGPDERRIIFSIWDGGGGAMSRSEVPAEKRTTLLAKGEDVVADGFGGEGSGGHSHLLYMWKTGVKQRFLVTAQPTNGTFTIYSGYYYHPERQRWMLISSWRAPQDGQWMHGLNSFSEDFNADNAQVLRKALYGNQWIRTAEGQWQELTTANFSCDPTGKKDRMDRFMGVEGNCFFLANCGFGPGFTPYGAPFTRPATGHAPFDFKVAELTGR